jgi:hypothetical protein
MAVAGKLRGRRLSIAVWGVSMWAILMFGYNQASAGVVLGEATFTSQFPQLDTTGTHSETKSAIQGNPSNRSQLGYLFDHHAEGLLQAQLLLSTLSPVYLVLSHAHSSGIFSAVVESSLPPHW